MGVAFLLALSPLAGATGLRSPYHGTLVVGHGSSVFGCSSARATHPAWSMATGKGTLGTQTAVSRTCPRSIPGAYSDSAAEATGALHLGIKIKVPGGIHTVNPTFSLTWNVTNSLSNGRGCPAPKPFNESSSNAPPNAKSAYWDNATGAVSTCSSYTYLVSYFEVTLGDLTNGTGIVPTSSPKCGVNLTIDECTPFYSYLYSFNRTGWEFYNDTTYSKGVWHYSSGVTSYNSSLTSATLAFTNSSTELLTPDFTYDFSATHRYELYAVFEVGVSTYVSDWIGGIAAATDNFGTSGNGVVLKNIVIT